MEGRQMNTSEDHLEENQALKWAWRAMGVVAGIFLLFLVIPASYDSRRGLLLPSAMLACAVVSVLLGFIALWKMKSSEVLRREIKDAVVCLLTGMALVFFTGLIFLQSVAHYQMRQIFPKIRSQSDSIVKSRNISPSVR
jgi:hypothetical protein